jgi:hypothetical protein
VIALGRPLRRAPLAARDQRVIAPERLAAGSPVGARVEGTRDVVAAQGAELRRTAGHGIDLRSEDVVHENNFSSRETIAI